MKTLPIQETFYTWQGEGVHLGKPAFFIRTYGCPVKCPWCDSAGTWHPDYRPEKLDRRTVDDLGVEALQSKAKIVVITGGEPAIHDLTELVLKLKQNDQSVHLETSGGFEIHGAIDWITLSPKRWKRPLLDNLKRANELKIIVESPECISFWWDQIKDHIETDTVWLHPEWSLHNNKLVLNAISEAVKKQIGPFRAGYQLHKLYQVDHLDKRSAAPVPLGGDPAKGY